MGQVGTLASLSPLGNRCEGASSLSSGMFRTHAVEDIGAVVEWLTERCSFHADAKSNLRSPAQSE